jgi:peroxiredoxin
MKRLLLIFIACLLMITLQCGGSESEQSDFEPAQTSAQGSDSLDSPAVDESMAFIESLDRENIEEMYDRVSLGPAPDFKLFDLNRTEITLQDYEGYVILLTFWSMNSVESKDLFSVFTHVHDKYRDSGFAVLAVVMDQNTREKFQEFADFNRLPYRIVYPISRAIYRDYGVSAPPLTYLIDRKGNVVGRFIANPGQEKLEKVIELFL